MEFYGVNRRRSGIYNGDQQKCHMVQGSFFWPSDFKGCNTLLWKHTCYYLRIFQNFYDEPRNFCGVFTKGFPQPPCLLFFQSTPLIDRQTFCSECSDTLPSALAQNFLLNLPKYVLIICCQQSEIFYFYETIVTYAIVIS